MVYKFTSPAFLVFCLTTPTLADTVIADDIIGQDNLCIGGTACVDGESFGAVDIKIKASIPTIRFDDGNTTANDWDVVVDAASAPGNDTFAVRDATHFRYPFVIEPNAPTGAIYIDDVGLIGLGTTLPAEELNIVSASSTAEFRMEEFVSAHGSWDIEVSSSYFQIRDNISGLRAVQIENASPEDAFYIQDTGNIGLGTDTPDAQLELSSTNSFNFFRITATGAATNESVDITFTGGPLGTGQLRYNIVDGDNQEMSLDADGNMVLDGTLTTTGPTCAGGCDAVFDADYALPSIEDHADAMFRDRHLPAVGPTLPHVPVNMTEKMGNILNELEHAHIYIAQQQDNLKRAHDQIGELHDRLAEQEAFAQKQADIVASLVARLAFDE